jgi:hypothetical protein
LLVKVKVMGWRRFAGLSGLKAAAQGIAMSMLDNRSPLVYFAIQSESA